ncbi:MAG: hypothetical protein UV65_C0003G0002 [Parcubacteria group bacterium GW2011_GWF2_43_11]|nr:MAG: hypothetical protein UV65_C0003G0002 [Parcubacteria group bacterium GW2011_GWF2_43_11]
MVKKAPRYAILEVGETSFNSHKDAFWLQFTNGKQAEMWPVVHYEADRFPPGTVVVCRAIWGKPSVGKSGYTTVGIAKVTTWSADGRPEEFGDELSAMSWGSKLGGWRPPGADETIYDEREEKVPA